MRSLLDGVVVQNIFVKIEDICLMGGLGLIGGMGLMGWFVALGELRFCASGTPSQLIERVKLCFMKLPSPTDFEAGGFIDLIHILEQHFYRAYCFSRPQFSASSNSDTSVKR